MELKSYYRSSTSLRIPSLNRTFMELKSLRDSLQDIASRGLNRTFMELKSLSNFLPFLQKLSQSYLYGIEI